MTIIAELGKKGMGSFEENIAKTRWEGLLSQSLIARTTQNLRRDSQRRLQSVRQRRATDTLVENSSETQAAPRLVQTAI
jgi:hypothetical protein